MEFQQRTDHNQRQGVPAFLFLAGSFDNDKQMPAAVIYKLYLVLHFHHVRWDKSDGHLEHRRELPKYCDCDCSLDVREISDPRRLIIFN